MTVHDVLLLNSSFVLQSVVFHWEDDAFLKNGLIVYLGEADFGAVWERLDSLTRDFSLIPLGKDAYSTAVE